MVITLHWEWMFRDKKIYKILMCFVFVVIPVILYSWLGLHKLTLTQAAIGIVIAGAVVLVMTIGVRIYEVYQKQESEIQMYQMYTKPLEELIREIRARQHEFRNHLNAILNMHLTVDNYDELVRTQSDYILSVADDKRNSYLPLLRISDKILAGFLYTKLVSPAKDVDFSVEIGANEIVTNAMEKDIIEVIGTLIDNAVDACDKDNRQIKLFLSSNGSETKDTADDRLIFEIMNEYPPIPMKELTRFFERGYSTKSAKGNRGYGLYNARRIINQYKGEIILENRTVAGRNYVCFHIEL